MKITSEYEQVSNKVQETKTSVATGGLSGRGHRTVRWHKPDYPVHQGVVAQWLVPGGTRGEKPPDYAV
jgi:hypothetical protein